MCTVSGTNVTMFTVGTCTSTPTAPASGNYVTTVGSPSDTTTAAQLSAPSSVTAVDASATAITVSFASVTNASSYTVSVYTNSGLTGTPTTFAEFTSGSDVTGLTPGSAYWFTVTTIGNATNYSNSAASSSATASTTAASVTHLTTPAAPSISNSGSSVTVTYSPDANAFSSTITLYNETTTTKVSLSHVNTGSHTFAGLVIGDVYHATITSIGDGTTYTTSAEGSASSSVTLTLAAAATLTINTQPL